MRIIPHQKYNNQCLSTKSRCTHAITYNFVAEWLCANSNKTTAIYVWIDLRFHKWIICFMIFSLQRNFAGAPKHGIRESEVAYFSNFLQACIVNPDPMALTFRERQISIFFTTTLFNIWWEHIYHSGSVHPCANVISLSLFICISMSWPRSQKNLKTY